MSSFQRIALMTPLLLGWLTASALAQQSVPQASAPEGQNYPRWSVRAVFGSARIHSWDDRGGWADFRVGRTIGSRMTSIDVGIGGSGSRGEFMALTTGLELRPWPLARVAPFVRVEAGVLGESDFGGLVAGTGGGLVFRLGSRLGFRAGAGLNVHGNAKGPVTYYSGLEYRW